MVTHSEEDPSSGLAFLSIYLAGVLGRSQVGVGGDQGMSDTSPISEYQQTSTRCWSLYDTSLVTHVLKPKGLCSKKPFTAIFGQALGVIAF